MLLSGCLVEENQHGYSHPPAYEDEAAGSRKQAGGHLLQGNDNHWVKGEAVKERDGSQVMPSSIR